MNHWHIGKIVELKKEDIKDKDEIFYIIKYYHGDTAGYHSNDIRIRISKNKGISLSEINGEGFIFLYPEQVKHLIKILTKGMRK